MGYLNGQPAIRAKETLKQEEGGGASSTFELELVLLRPARIEIRESESYLEDADGRVVEFTIDHDEGGQRTTAVGRVVEERLEVQVFRLGRRTEQSFELPPSPPLLGQHATQELLAGLSKQEGTTAEFLVPQLLQGEIVLSKTTATRQPGDHPDRSAFSLLSDLTPLPVFLEVDEAGHLLEMSMAFGPFRLALVPTEEEPELLGAELPPTGLVEAEGGPPSTRGVNRYRLPASVRDIVPEDEFQRKEGDLMVVHPAATPTELLDPTPYLVATPQLELDDPALREWALETVTGSADPLESLRLAVRSHIREKDLSKGDASALETFRDRRGDCTEHANLLAAAGRIAGIPTRIEIGFVWAPDYGGWVGHAWNSAFDADAGRWRHLDAAYPGLSRGLYIKLAAVSQLDAAGTGQVLGTVLSRILGTPIEILSPPAS